MNKELEKRLGEIFRGRSDMVVADVGAAKGGDTLQYAAFFQGSTVHAFEPLPRNISAFEQKLRSAAPEISRRITLHPFALGEVESTTSFWASKGKDSNSVERGEWSASSSILEPTGHRDHYRKCGFEKNETSVRRMDSVDLSKVDYLHMDVQGAELAVLRGAGDLVKTMRAVWMEVSYVELYRGQPLEKDVSEYMTKAGFALDLDVRRTIQGDQLWVRKK